MSVLVDTSVWSLAFRRRTPSIDPSVVRLQKIMTSGQRMYLLGIILQELLEGLRKKSDAEALKAHFDPFPMIDLARNDYVYGAEIFNLCRNKGIQLTTIDCLVAAAAINYKCALLTADKDFVLASSVIPLQLI